MLYGYAVRVIEQPIKNSESGWHSLVELTFAYCPIQSLIYLNHWLENILEMANFHLNLSCVEKLKWLARRFFGTFSLVRGFSCPTTELSDKWTLGQVFPSTWTLIYPPVGQLNPRTSEHEPIFHEQAIKLYCLLTRHKAVSSLVWASIKELVFAHLDQHAQQNKKVQSSLLSSIKNSLRHNYYSSYHRTSLRITF